MGQLFRRPVFIPGTEISDDLLEQLGLLRMNAWTADDRVPLGFQKGKPWLDNDIEKLPQTTHVIVYTEDGSRIAASSRMTLCTTHDDVPDAAYYRQAGFLDELPAPLVSLNRLVTHPDCQKLGLGSFLDRARIQRAAEIGAKSVVVYTPTKWRARSNIRNNGYPFHANLGEVLGYPGMTTNVMGGPVQVMLAHLAKKEPKANFVAA